MSEPEQDTVTVNFNDLRRDIEAALEGWAKNPFPDNDTAVREAAKRALQVLHGDTSAVVLRCPGGCFEGSYDEPPAPEEDCPVHGRSYLDVWNLATQLQQRAREASQQAAQAREEVTLARSERQNAIDALRNLVDLKDGPRNDHYEQAKPMAWDVARMIVGSSSQAIDEGMEEARRRFEEAVAHPQRLVVMPERKDDVTAVVGPSGKITSLIFHDVMYTSLDTIQSVQDEIEQNGGATILVLGDTIRLHEVVVTREPEDVLGG